METGADPAILEGGGGSGPPKRQVRRNFQTDKEKSKASGRWGSGFPKKVGLFNSHTDKQKKPWKG